VVGSSVVVVVVVVAASVAVGSVVEVLKMIGLLVVGLLLKTGLELCLWFWCSDELLLEDDTLTLTPASLELLLITTEGNNFSVTSPADELVVVDVVTASSVVPSVVL
jgi:hypothetical protein